MSMNGIPHSCSRSTITMTQQLQDRFARFHRYRDFFMATPPLTRRSALHWIGWMISTAVILSLTGYWPEWAKASPMAELWNVAVNYGLPIPSGPGGRLQYLRRLVIAQREHASRATCILCSVTVLGSAGEVIAYWGDVTIETGAGLGPDGIRVNGGRVTLKSGVQTTKPMLLANGGQVIIDPRVEGIDPKLVHASPRFYYPGQRSYPREGLQSFVSQLLLVAVFGGWLPWGRTRGRIEEAAKRPFRSAMVGVVLLIVVLPFFNLLTALFVRVLPWVAGILLFLLPSTYWVVSAIGFSAVAACLGCRLGIASRLGARVAGAVLLIMAMLVPVLGLVTLIPLTLVALGAGTSITLGSRFDRLQRTARQPDL